MIKLRSEFNAILCYQATDGTLRVVGHPAGNQCFRVYNESLVECVEFLLLNAGWGPLDISWFINPMNTIVIGTIKHSYWSYKPT